MTAALCTSACVNLPYIEPTRDGVFQPSGRGSLEDAVNYADRSYDAYEAKIIEEWRRQQGLSTLLIGAGALAIGAGLADAHRDVFRVLGLGSATAYQLGSWNQNAGRIGIYLDGMKALGCAKAAVQPLRLSKEARDRIREAQKQLLIANQAAADAMALAGPARVNPSSTLAAQALQAELQGLMTDLEEAWRQHARASSVDQRIDGAGAMLQQKVDQIRTAIDTALHATQADPAALRLAIQGLSAYTLQFNTDAQGAALAIAQGLATGSGNTGLDKSESQRGANGDKASHDLEASIGKALGAVSGARIRIKGATAELRGTTDRQFEGIGESMNGCGVDASKLTTPLALEEGSVQLKAGQVRTTVIMAKGGTRPLSVAPVESAAPGLTVTVSPEGGSLLVVADNKTEVGAFRFKLRDAAGQTVSLVVTVTGDTKTAPAPGADTKESAPVSLCDNLGRLSQARICYLQQQLEVDIDGRVGSQTCGAFRKQVGQNARTAEGGFEFIAQRSGLTAGSTDDKVMSMLGSDTIAKCVRRGKTSTSGASGTGPKPGGSPNAAGTVAGLSGGDVKLSEDQVAALARALGQPKGSSLERLREALADNQRVSNCPSTGGVFTESEVKRLYDGGRQCR